MPVVRHPPLTSSYIHPRLFCELSTAACYITAVREFDVIVLGGGAAGLMCAIAAGRRGRRVVVLEGANKIGKKILMSGGGRCNFTNLNTQPSNFISANPHFCKSALSRYTPSDFVAMVDSHEIAHHEKTQGQLFCDHSSKDILAMLVAECASINALILTDCDVSSVEFDNHYLVNCKKGKFKSESLVIATGGLSIPKMGATDFGYRLARQFGLAVNETRAGLVPFTFSGAVHELAGRLSGVSLPAILTTDNVSFADDILFTHRGLSGPAALQLSSYFELGQYVHVNLLPQIDLRNLLLHEKEKHPKVLLRSLLSERLPRNLVIELQALFWPDVAERPVGEIGNNKLCEIAAQLHCWPLKPSGTEGYRTAEVTLGGIDTDELSSKTMESARQPGLYCIGEVVDVTGHLGGFNFQWAWASAQAAGCAV